MIQRTCNRCQAPVEKALNPAPQLVVVPASSPSTVPVAADGDFQIGLVTGVDANGMDVDYCPACLLSVVMARLMPTADRSMAEQAVTTITAQRDTIAVKSVAAPGA